MSKLFESKEAFRSWLSEYYKDEEGVWLVFGKKDGPETLTPDEALKEALCFGWIDGQIKSVDEYTYLKYFKKRLKKSNWSKRNRDFVEQLIKDGKMTDSGYQAIETAKRNGSWEVEHEFIRISDVLSFQEQLEDYELAYQNFMRMSSSIQRTYVGFYLSAKKEETRVKRFKELIIRFEKNLKPLERE